ncbi:hypothetical protein D3C75_950880 [compost metagenome]
MQAGQANDLLHEGFDVLRTAQDVPVVLLLVLILNGLLQQLRIAPDDGQRSLDVMRQRGNLIAAGTLQLPLPLQRQAQSLLHLLKRSQHLVDLADTAGLHGKLQVLTPDILCRLLETGHLLRQLASETSGQYGGQQ